MRARSLNDAESPAIFPKAQTALHEHQLNSKLGTSFLNQIPKLQPYKDSWEE